MDLLTGDNAVCITVYNTVWMILSERVNAVEHNTWSLMPVVHNEV